MSNLPEEICYYWLIVYPLKILITLICLFLRCVVKSIVYKQNNAMTSYSVVPMFEMFARFTSLQKQRATITKQRASITGPVFQNNIPVFLLVGIGDFQWVYD